MRIRWCVSCLGVIVLCVAWGNSSQLTAQVLRLPPVDVPTLREPQPPSSIAVGVNPTLSSALVRRGDLWLPDTPLAAALLTIGDIWKVNVVVGQEVTGKVQGRFTDAPLYEILDSILLSNGYAYRPVGNSLVILPLEKLGDLNPMFESATIRLGNTDPADILEGVRLLNSPQGKSHALPTARSLIVLDFPDRVTRIRQFVEQLDRVAFVPPEQPLGPAAEEIEPLEVAHFSPQFVSATSLLPAVQTVLSEKGQAAAMESEGKLIVADYRAELELARQLVEQLDVPSQQIRITALIYDLDVQDIERLGINWNHALKDRPDADGNPQSVWNINSLLAVPVNAGLPDGTMTFMNLSEHFDITAMVKALQEAKDSRLLANPNATVLDHQTAMMKAVKEIPYQQLTETPQGGSIGTTAFREAGIMLDVTPHIAADGTIKLDVTTSFSRLTGYTPGQQAQPIIDSREAQTTVRVANGQVLVIGGLRQRTDTGDFNGIPYLKDIKKWNIGALFRGRDTEVRESELVVFIMSEIAPPVNALSCREDAALQFGRQLLEQVPVATDGRPPRRPTPYCPPTPIGGPRATGIPHQAVTYPPPCVVPPPASNPCPLPERRMVPMPSSQFRLPPNGSVQPTAAQESLFRSPRL